MERANDLNEVDGTAGNVRNFTIMVNGLSIDPELPEHIRAQYYDLCFARNRYLHKHLIRGLSSELIVAVICETVNIANLIKTCTLTTSRDEFADWDKILKSLKLFGMSVGFLQRRVRKLLRLANESDGARPRKYMAAKLGQVQVENEIRNLETKIIEWKDASKKFDADIEASKFQAESYERKFQEEVDAP